jgi:hypothetical protein
LDPEDSNEKPVPAIFENYDTELGLGGYMTLSSSEIVQGPGQGGSVRLSSTDGSLVEQKDGSDGLVVLRWKPAPAPAPVAAAPVALAKTGADSNSWQLAGTAGILVFGVGAAFTAFAYRAKRRAS